MFNVGCPKCNWSCQMSGAKPNRHCKCGQDLKDYWRCDHGKKAEECTDARCIFNKKNMGAGESCWQY